MKFSTTIVHSEVFQKIKHLTYAQMFDTRATEITEFLIYKLLKIVTCGLGLGIRGSEKFIRNLQYVVCMFF